MDNEKLRKFVHGKLFELLQFSDNICKQEKIPYSLFGGSMLGAIRHNGFIPWDDDVDILMKREDFERFKQVAAGYIENTPYSWYKHDRVEGIGFTEPFELDGATVANLCLDVFILDNAPDDERAFRKQIFGLKKLQGMMKKGKTDWKKYNLKGKILIFGTKILGAFHSKKKILEKYTALSTKYNNSATGRKFVSNNIYATIQNTFDNYLVEDIIEHKFEDGSFSVYAHYDEFLTASYGDYMTLPPEEKRVFNHSNVE